MRPLPGYNAEASFRPRQLRDYSEPAISPGIRLQVRQTFWQRLCQAFGI
jgi:hypothetical protein